MIVQQLISSENMPCKYANNVKYKEHFEYVDRIYAGVRDPDEIKLMSDSTKLSSTIDHKTKELPAHIAS